MKIIPLSYLLFPMSSKIDEVEEKVSSTNSKVSTIESDVEEVKKSVGWNFVGMGIFVTVNGSYGAGGGRTLAGCLGVCTGNRSIESQWNGMVFRSSGGCVRVKRMMLDTRGK